MILNQRTAAQWPSGVAHRSARASGQPFQGEPTCQKPVGTRTIHLTRDPPNRWAARAGHATRPGIAQPVLRRTCSRCVSRLQKTKTGQCLSEKLVLVVHPDSEQGTRPVTIFPPWVRATMATGGRVGRLVLPRFMPAKPLHALSFLQCCNAPSRRRGERLPGWSPGTELVESVPQNSFPGPGVETGWRDTFSAACLSYPGSGFPVIGSHCPPRHLWRAVAAAGSQQAWPSRAA